MKVRFYQDPITGIPHIYEHNVIEEEVIEILESACEDRSGKDGSRVAIGQTHERRYLKIIYVSDPEPDSLFVITAYDLLGKPLKAYKARKKRKK
ncbi:hypothetical protein KKB18_07595 [bacterium]|nr:hypothetical protein [bacterium]